MYMYQVVSNIDQMVLVSGVSLHLLVRNIHKVVGRYIRIADQVRKVTIRIDSRDRRLPFRTADMCLSAASRRWHAQSIAMSESTAEG